MTRRALTWALLLVNAAVWAGWLPVTAADAYTQPAALNDGTDYSDVCPPRPADTPTSDSDEAQAVGYLTQEVADACVRTEQLQSNNEAQWQDAAGQLDGDVFLLAGLTIGIAIFDIFLRKVWP